MADNHFEDNNFENDNFGDNELSDFDYNIKVIKNIFLKYKKYIAAGAALVVLAVIIADAVPASKQPEAEKEPVQSSQADEESGVQTEEFEVDAYPAINALIEEYYGYSASGDTDAIEKIALPVTDTEKSYIKLFSAYVDKYENIKCYTKKGAAGGEFLVLAVLDTKYKDIGTAEPGQACFYVRKNVSGAYYIDNAYSQFNQSNLEITTEEEINELIAEFEEGGDYIALQKEIQKNYLKALEDEDLKKMVTETLQDVISTWVASIGVQASADDGAADNAKPDDAQAGGTNTDDTQAGGTNIDDTHTDDTKPDDGQAAEPAEGTSNGTDVAEVAKRTAYAKTKVNLRKTRSVGSEPLAVLAAGTELTVYGESKDGWLKVKADGKTGFVKEEYVVSDKSEVEKEDTADTAKRTAYAKTKVNMRKQQSTDSDVVLTLKAGTKVTIYGTDKDGWFKVKAEGKTGYVKKEYIVFDKSKVEKEEESGNAGTPAAPRPSYYQEGTQITLVRSVNIRQSMSESAERVALAYQGDVVTVIMSYAEGWTKVSYHGQTGYVKTEFL